MKYLFISSSNLSFFLFKIGTGRFELPTPSPQTRALTGLGHVPFLNKKIGAAGFEPAITYARGKCLTRLGHAPLIIGWLLTNISITLFTILIPFKPFSYGIITN